MCPSGESMGDMEVEQWLVRRVHRVTMRRGVEEAHMARLYAQISFFY